MTVINVQYNGGPFGGKTAAVLAPDMPTLQTIHKWKTMAHVVDVFVAPDTPPLQLIYTLEFDRDNRYRLLEGFPLMMYCAGELDD